MDINAPEGTLVIYLNESDAAIKWGNNYHPGAYLNFGQTYTIERTEIHSQHTKVYLKEVPDKYFNSVHFE